MLDPTLLLFIPLAFCLGMRAQHRMQVLKPALLLPQPTRFVCIVG